MDPKVYLETQTRLLELARQVRELDLEGMLGAIGTAETVAPILDPTAYRHGAKNLGIIRRLAEGGLAFQRSYPEYGAAIEGALEAQSYHEAAAPRRPGRQGASSRRTAEVDEPGEKP